jgi:2-polyprenyl-6-methoxyphenol hydroxylase-like FAD-dependent oxidoreductase
MNLGWLDAEAAVQSIIQCFKNPADQTSQFLLYSKKQRRVAKKVVRRAEMNMWLGRKESSSRPVKWIMAVILNTPLSGLLARLFTMRGLGK